LKPRQPIAPACQQAKPRGRASVPDA